MTAVFIARRVDSEDSDLRARAHSTAQDAKRRSMRLQAFAAALCLSARCDGLAAAPPVALSLGVHHLVDAALLAATNGTFFALGTLAKDIEAPLIVPEFPWEAALHFYTSLVSFDGSYFLYYGCSDQTLFFYPIGVCVATSRDGRAWTKPRLSIHPYTANGTLPPVDSNIIFYTEPNTFGLHVFTDARPRAAAPIVLAYESETAGARFVRTATSADGLVFAPAAADPSAPAAINISGFADTAVSVTYDAGADAYVAFGRRDTGVPNSNVGCAGANPVFRNIVRSAKPCGGGGGVCSPTEAANWSAPAPVLALAPGAPDAPDCLDNYNPAALPPLPDAGAGALFVALPSVMRHMPRADSGAPDDRAGANDGWMDVRLATSRDGGNFSFPSRDAFIRRGAGARDAASGLYNATGSEPDAGFVFATNGGLLDADPAAPYVHILYWGSQTTHAGGGAYLARYVAGARTGVFRARMRREGWAGLANLPATPSGAGAATTVALRLPPAAAGLFLRFNAAVDAAGSLSVAILDAASGAPLPGFAHGDCAAITGNGVRQLLTCAGAGPGGDLAGLAARGAPIAFDFRLTHCTVYAWALAAE